jgi:type II secretory pathway pseudopilin PulG
VRPPRDDEGVSLVELLVAMTLMAMVGAMFTSGILEVYRSLNKTDSDYVAQSQINQAFSTLDREVRYAKSVSTPATVSGDWYVEYLVEINNVDTCVELRLNTTAAQLQRRCWSQGVTPVAPTTWNVLASNVAATTPFTVLALDKQNLTGFRFQRMTVNFTSTSGGSGTGTTRQTTVTFAALNATASDNASTCIEGRKVP